MERQELLDYVKDVYELESQLYSLQGLYNYYWEIGEELNQENENVCFSEEFTCDNLEHYKLCQASGVGASLPSPNTYMLNPNTFATLDFNYLQVYDYLPPRYRLELDAIIKKLNSNIFTKLNAYDCSHTSKLRKEYQSIYAKRYNEELTQKRIWIEPRKNNVRIELNEHIIPNCKKTEELLDKIYSLNIIHPKYQNFVAIAQIYEYLDTGRCDALEGPNGAYNLYEQELRQNTIIDKLEQVNDKLDTLNRTMRNVCDAIYESNRLLQNISRNVAGIEANTACIAYNTQCVAYNTRIANQYNF